ncbi:hypothetical protein BDR26DRAFT_849354 [Obelidium mucronatum]|nr:hypothetical protein BDR26DRAFT_849354 [Obelidium mucronatum]
MSRLSTIRAATAIQQQDTHKMFLFAYGSLINPLSLKRTIGRTETAVVPVIVSGFRRSWGFNCIKRSYTAVSITQSDCTDDKVNGVLIPVTAFDLDYLRKQVSVQAISPYLNDADSSKTSSSWVFVAGSCSKCHCVCIFRPPWAQLWPLQSTHVASAKTPIPQSYIDCILTGALREYGHAFARDFVNWTQGWQQSHWINDRYASDPIKRYIPNVQAGECGVDPLLAESVDLMLSGIIPTAFQARIDV